MQFLYDILVNTAEKLLPVSGIFSEKMKLSVEGRKKTFSHLEEQVSASDKTIWFHTASLGEYEQAVPVIEAVRERFPKHKIVVSFFSPSGYEIKKNSALADVVVYLPIDTRKNAKKFLELVHPEWALFVKYEFWPNFLRELSRQKIPTVLVSGAFRKDQSFFKSYGGWMRKSLNTFRHFFVQNEHSKELLNSIGFENVSVSGDTRFDRVSDQLSQNNELDFAEEFKNNELCVVAGSTWPEDEALLVDYFNSAPEKVKFMIAPHTLKPEKIRSLREKLEVSTVLFSEKEGKNLEEYRVMIVDTIGLLTKLYNYADIAYVGGAAGNTGLHNILEPATFGVPVIIGKNFSKFPEAIKLQQLAGLFSVADKEELSAILGKLAKDENFRKSTGMICGHYVNSNTGATGIIINYLETASVENGNRTKRS
ncbi:3-deoxy-D-manno-octulosonic-acid transferase [Salinimicrobium catena]|uniref:3-deoxy-D-manno-octulosonic acid transferase n=1 Tax=Salinimicrobium catena TaxID=390640 RepID=A0A1H5P5Q1_9FLAO|nr:glycosyltransferase N-terminal domain-containing protein [Salinimicrobium catena]SDL71520.1 3-deoxy-D-manno-octulosonic-acid transferase [Salinimicrobium catena]SEF09195.1 3-deoxy-D-manno-octulosonic-acid transferase [Salinimicrobium catena]